MAPIIAVASKPDDTTADAVAAAFVEARQAVHLSKLARIDRNTLGEKVCKHDLRMSSGLIKDVQYETSDPARLPDTARQLATSPDAYKIAARFGVGVCSLGPDSSGKISYSVSGPTGSTTNLNLILALMPLLGIGCQPVLIKGNKQEFLAWIGKGVRAGKLNFPSTTGPIQWRGSTLANIFGCDEANRVKPASTA